ncbi:hypothetical protein RHSIM_Rhsim01G0131900 [Rhododendron simsii]|uniref:Transposase MuDR plant domain-containing protein n=1 Tax=Rhododendron simsii TaxID=118357 RepID=A0A834HUL0_RHOSS|nr:hypothetical protein RHSIM_Rhsim01G0131900 [Rhododendron simsii]
MAGRRDEDMAEDPWVCSSRVLYKCMWVKFFNRYEIYVLISLLESPIKVSCRGMGSALYFDINVHFDGKVSRIKNIEPHKYGYMDLLDDVSSRSFNHLPSDRGFTIKMYGYKPGTNERMDVSSDLDVIEMFGFYCNICVLDLHVEVCDVEGPPFPYIPSTTDTTLSFPSVSTNPHDCVNVEDDSSDHEWSKNSLDISDKEVEWDDESSEEFIGYGFEEDIEVSSDGMSEYSLGDDGGKESSSDSDIITYGPTFKPFDPTKCGEEFQVDARGKIRLATGLLFGNATKFREVLKEFTIQEGCKIVREKNEKTRITCRCAVVGCKWRIHASPLADGVTFKIKTYRGEHTCISETSNFEANSTWIAKKMANELRANPNMSLDCMQVLLHQKYGIEASRIQLYRAKRKALEVIEGNHSDSYPLLTTYASEVRKSNPGSLVKIQCDRLTETHNPVFKRYFICFEAMRTGFMEGYRPFIGIDGCHLKGPFGGVLLAVVALDGNNGLFPIAVGVVESEGRDSWAFFIDHLHTVIGAGTHARAWTFMSDQQKGLDKVIAEMVPKAARAYNEIEFGYAMESIKSISVEAHKWLSEVSIVWSCQRAPVRRIASRIEAIPTATEQATPNPPQGLSQAEGCTSVSSLGVSQNEKRIFQEQTLLNVTCTEFETDV